MLLNENQNNSQVFLDHLNHIAPILGMRFAPLRGKLLLQNVIGTKLTAVFPWVHVGDVDGLNHLDSCVSLDDRISGGDLRVFGRLDLYLPFQSICRVDVMPSQRSKAGFTQQR